jgi:phenylacetate-coenzyme A ligase PaaK-like adenylate-forming protein
MFEISQYFDIKPYSVGQTQKNAIMNAALLDLTRQHYAGCKLYRRMMDATISNPNILDDTSLVPMLPVRLFKEYDLLSVNRSDIIKTMTSSGTSGQRVSKIFLDKNNAVNQSKVLTKILASYLGTKRLPMLVIDTKSVLKDHQLFSARGAGIIGFSMLGYDVTYALDDEMNLDIEAVSCFLKKYEDSQVLIFGFTFMIWKYLVEILRNTNTINVSNGILIHGGGWKKLQEKSVDNRAFKKAIFETMGVKKVFNYYGMVEQTGSIFMECEEGALHASLYSDIIIRTPQNLEIVPNRKEGLIQLLSILPTSYPGHSILTEDIGAILGEDDCPCGRLGKYFNVYGRIQNAEVRGCSDTFS